jgi:UrcA family protein
MTRHSSRIHAPSPTCNLSSAQHANARRRQSNKSTCSSLWRSQRTSAPQSHRIFALHQEQREVRMKTLQATLAAAVVAVMGVAPAHAQQAEVMSVTVRYGDLDLTNPRDAHTMVRRIDNAAARACGGDPSSQIFDGLIARARAVDDFESCRDIAVRDALSQLGSVEVMAAYRAAGAVRLG